MLYDYIVSLYGLHYRWGGDDTIEGMDCSGFVLECYQSIGIIKHGHDSTSQGLYDTLLNKSLKIVASPPFGALCFYGKSYKEITHVAISLGQGLIAEAGGGGRDTTSPEVAARRNAFIKLRPYNYRRDYIISLLPPEFISIDKETPKL